MKTLFNPILLVLFYTFCFSQDIVILKDSTKYEGKILTIYEKGNIVALMMRVSKPDLKGGKRFLLPDIIFLEKDGEIFHDIKNSISKFKKYQWSGESEADSNITYVNIFKKKSRFFLTFGSGVGNFNNPLHSDKPRLYSYTLGLNYFYQNNIFTAHFLLVSNNSFLVKRDIGTSDLGLLYGRGINFKDIFLYASIGLSHVNYKIYDYSALDDYYYDYKDYARTKSLETTNIAVEIKIFFIPQGKFGIGATLFLSYILDNQNSEELFNFNGIMLSFLL
jgi:hypothetical protein